MKRVALFLRPKAVKQRKYVSANVSFCDPVQSTGFSKQTRTKNFLAPQNFTEHAETSLENHFNPDFAVDGYCKFWDYIEEAADWFVISNFSPATLSFSIISKNTCTTLGSKCFPFSCLIISMTSSKLSPAR